MDNVILTQEFAEDIIFGLHKLEGFKITLGALEIASDYSNCNQSSIFWETSPDDVLFYQVPDGMRIIYNAPDDPLKLQYFSYVFYYDRISSIDGSRKSLRAFFVNDNTTMVNGLNGLVIKNLIVPNLSTYTGAADSLYSSPVDDPQLKSINQIITQDAKSIGNGESLFDDGLLPNAATKYGWDTLIKENNYTGVNNNIKYNIYIPTYA